MTWSTLPALMYHSVSSVGGPLRDLAVPPERLAEQLAALSGAGYRLVGLTEALDLLERGSAEKMVAVTFDDGYRDFLTQGVPALRKAGAGATLYASVGHLGGRAGWLGEWADDFGPMMTWEDLDEVAASGVEIGNHSLIHHPLDVLTAAQLREEVVSSHDRLEQRLQRKVRSFAYPHGYNSDLVRRVVEQSGHDNATEVGRRVHTPSERRFAVPRFQPTPDHTGADLVALIEGGPVLSAQLKQYAQPGWRMVRKLARKAGRNLT
ncbi:polysaccharide deacetylase family protein [Actinoplanes couchii]|uniref:Polysaccharide deacetylase n=1 Tax=Actinoplanes couchii TaxID=403638 RepID=A0ABQ3X1J2_9ACTN|nr:polysaccharide deacetylase family protein [Actinoplanes couchii]MDR6316777.1 peptidoglycan/xylan/chitin deacetylase (PgdA/CDA1 family) [Actinoplanes couchii]GID52385.1 polysaccharide deacetylase [Actinoplanes couchii]